jgi:hypothetical protein
VLAVVLAILIWLQINLLKDQTVNVRIPVRIVNVPDNIYVDKNKNLSLKFEIKGQGIAIISYLIANPSLEYDASSLTIGKNILVRERILPFFKKYKQLKFTPLENIENTHVSTERIVQKKIPIQLLFKSDKDKQYFYSQQIDIEEKSAIISGPSNDVQNIDIVYTEEITEDLLKDSKKIKFNLNNERIIIIPAQLSLVSQKQMITSRTISNIDIENNNDFVIFPDQVSVIIEGKRDSLNAFNSSNIKASVNPNNGEIIVELENTNSIKIKDFTPQKVTIRKKK